MSTTATSRPTGSATDASRSIKLPGTVKLQPPDPIKRFFGWYYTRIYIHVRPERIYVWPRGDIGEEPRLYDAHMEEVRSGHSEEPERFHADPVGGASSWDPRIAELGTRYRTAVLSIVCARRLPVRAQGADPRGRRQALDHDREARPTGVPLQPGLACLTAHTHSPDFTWQQNFQVRGDLVYVEDGWALIPHKLVGGFELPPSRVAVLRANAAKVRRFRRIAKRELARRS